jgi:hypothetical protein
MGLIAVRKRFNVTAVDIESVKWFYKHPNFKFIQGDIFKLEFSPAYFDLIINYSTIEHVGLAGRYEVIESRPDGDIEAMKILKTILKLNGIMLLTIPVGRDKGLCSSASCLWSRTFAKVIIRLGCFKERILDKGSRKLLELCR